MSWHHFKKSSKFFPKNGGLGKSDSYTGDLRDTEIKWEREIFGTFIYDKKVEEG